MLLVIGGAIALCGGMIQEWRRERKEWKLRPVLQEFDDPARSEADTKLENGLVRYYRIPIKNIGKTTAVKCRGFLWKVERLDDGQWCALDYQDTLPLNWSFMPEETVHEGVIIPPGIPQHLDVVAATTTSFFLKTKPRGFGTSTSSRHRASTGSTCTSQQRMLSGGRSVGPSRFSRHPIAEHVTTWHYRCIPIYHRR